MKILVIDDDPALAKTLEIALRTRGSTIAVARNAEEGLTRIANIAPDLVILDLGLPDIDGIEVCRRIRQFSTVPIIVLSADGDEARKVIALDAGADDYVTKPFGMAELEARIRVTLRHAKTSDDESTTLAVGNLVLDLTRKEATLPDGPLDLTGREFDLLAYLVRNSGRLCTHHMILKAVWGPGYGTETNYLRVYSHRLRAKLAGSGVTLRTHAGIGYQLIGDSAHSEKEQH